MVNIASAFLLRDEPHHHRHSHGHAHGHHHPGHDHHDGQDNNLRSAYQHVLADALTSVLAIAALLVGSMYGWLWADPLMGLVGARVIASWSLGLLRDTGGVLLDTVPQEPGEDVPAEIRAALEAGEDRITDLHVWQVGPGHHAAIIALLSPAPQQPADYKARLAHVQELSPITVEVARTA